MLSKGSLFGLYDQSYDGIIDALRGSVGDTTYNCSSDFMPVLA